MSYTPRDLSVGDHVVINTDMANPYGTFAAGHEFEVIDVHLRGQHFVYDLRDRDLNLLGEVSVTYLKRVPHQ